MASSKNKCDEFLRIVRAGRLDDMDKFVTTNGLLSADYLTQLVMSRYDGETPLLITIKYSLKPMFGYLIEKLNAPIGQTGRFLWNGKEYPKITPMLAAIISNQPYFVEYLIQRHKIGTWLLDQGEQITESRFSAEDDYGCGECRTNISPQCSYMVARKMNESPSSCSFSSIMSSSLQPLQKVEVLELIGSAFILYCPHTACLYGIPFLKQALVLGQSLEDGHQSAILNIIQPQFDPARNIVKNASEELEQEAGDYHRLCIRAFKISQQILNQLMNRPRHHPFLLYSLLRYAGKCYLRCQFEQVVDISQLILEQFQSCQWKTFTKRIRTWIFYTFHGVILPAIRELQQTPSENETKLIFSNVMFAVELAIVDASHTLTELAKRTNRSQQLMESFHDRKTRYVLDLAQLACNMLPKCNLKEKLEIKEVLARFIQLADNPKLSYCPSLHFVCSDVTITATDLIELLLAAGADPNAIDRKGNAPLYLIADKPWENVATNISAARILIKNGAHLNQINSVTLKTALQLFQRKERIYGVKI